MERTSHQDLGFGLRQLSDIALRALSSALNDPTTAVQCLDRRGAVRLVQDVPAWADLVDLGFAEIRGCAVGSPQVSRRLLAGIDDLLLLAPEDRREPLMRHRTLLARGVERTVPEAAEREFALLPDHQGIG